MGTLHANSTYDTITRLTNPPMNVPPVMINSIDFIIMQNRIYHPEKGIIRRVTEVAEVVGMENNKVQLNKIYEYNYSDDTHEYVAVTTNTLSEIANMKGLSNKEILQEIKNREKYLIKNIENERCNLYETKEILNNYYNM